MKKGIGILLYTSLLLIGCESKQANHVFSSIPAPLLMESGDAEKYVIAPSDTSIAFYNQAKAQQDIKAGTMQFIYWGNIVLLPQKFNSYVKKYGFTIYVVPECCREEPKNIAAYNQQIVAHIDQVYGKETFKNAMTDLVNQCYKEVGSISRSGK
jgi:hypothetical protein